MSRKGDGCNSEPASSSQQQDEIGFMSVVRNEEAMYNGLALRAFSCQIIEILSI